MNKDVFSIEGKESGKVELNDNVFNAEVSNGSIYHAIKNELANRRVGLASVKTRSEVAGTHKKPWKQKHLGRARSGQKQSPLWRGGGITFGPVPRDYSYKIPKKMKRKAIISTLSLKNKENSLIILEDFNIESGKTKELFNILKKFTKNPKEYEKVLLVVHEAHFGKLDDSFRDLPLQTNLDIKLRRKNASGLKKAAWNIPWLKIMNYNQLAVHDLFYSNKIILLKTSSLNLNEMYKEL